MKNVERDICNIMASTMKLKNDILSRGDTHRFPPHRTTTAVPGSDTLPYYIYFFPSRAFGRVLYLFLKRKPIKPTKVLSVVRCKASTPSSVPSTLNNNLKAFRVVCLSCVHEWETWSAVAITLRRTHVFSIYNTPYQVISRSIPCGVPLRNDKTLANDAINRCISVEESVRSYSTLIIDTLNSFLSSSFYILIRLSAVYLSTGTHLQLIHRYTISSVREQSFIGHSATCRGPIQLVAS